MRNDEGRLPTGPRPNTPGESLAPPEARPLFDVSERYFRHVRWIGDLPIAPSETIVLLRETHARIGELLEVLDIDGLPRAA